MKNISRRNMAVYAACLLFSCLGSVAQQADQITVVKPSEPGAQRYTHIVGNNFASGGTTVEDLMKFAYSLHPSQIVGGPEWIHSTKFDTVVDAERDNRPSPEELRTMVAKLLETRFQLVLVREKKDIPVFALVRTKKTNLKVDDHDEAYLAGGIQGQGALYVTHATVADFGRYLQRFGPPELNRPVVDQTAITGLFDFELHFTPSGASSGADPEQPESRAGESPDIFTAVQEQLGLKLKATHARVEVLRISSIAAPTPN